MRLMATSHSSAERSRRSMMPPCWWQKLHWSMNSFLRLASPKSMVEDQALAGCCAASAAGSASGFITSGLSKASDATVRSW